MKRIILIALLAALASTTLVAQVDIPLHNWTVPPYTTASTGGIHTMVDATPPRLFIGLPPCRLLDTRPPVNNPLDGDGVYAANEVRSYTLPGNCGIPIGTDAVSLNITVTNTVANPFGFIKVWPQGGAEPNVSTLNWATGGVTVANAAIVPLSAGGGISVRSGNAGSDVIIDVNGYFSDTLGTPGNYLYLTNDSGLWTAQFNNSSATCEGPCGVVAQVTSGWAIYATSSEVTADVNNGVYGQVNSTGTNSSGVYGLANNAAGVTYGVWGETNSLTTCSAGVRGLAGTVIPCLWGGTGGPGVYGTASATWGILGLSTGAAGAGRGVQGSRTDAAGNFQTSGVLGYSGNSGVHSFNDITAGGLKPFVVPYPGDASKQITYISLEGNEAGTYFRGRAKFDRGLATIDIPEDFRLVTEPEGLSIQVTPIGEMATVAVQSIGLDRIVMKGSRNVEFFYTVNGVRKHYENFKPIGKNVHFVPMSEDAKMDPWPEFTKQVLIENGIYRSDGTVNLETAQRMGWDKIWEQNKQRPEPQPIAEP